MSKLHILSEAQITASEGDAITVVLVEPDDMPSKIIIHWPPTPTEIPPRDFADVAALLTRVFARAATKLSQIRAQRK
jgi:hypothetical protein